MKRSDLAGVLLSILASGLPETCDTRLHGTGDLASRANG